MISSNTPVPGSSATEDSVENRESFLLQAQPRRAMLLNGEWKFSPDPEDSGLTNNWADSQFDDSAWESVEVPHTWNTMADHYDFSGIAWYRRQFKLAGEDKEALLRLRFEAVFYNAQVWLNGQVLGEHAGGYAPFEYDVREVVDPEASNVIAVRVDNNRSTNRIPATLSGNWSFDWWNYGGIVRNVSLEITNPIYISRQQITAIPTLAEPSKAEYANIRTVVTIENLTVKPFSGTLKTEIANESHKPMDVTVTETQFHARSGQSIDVELAIVIQEPELWHFDHPNLYTMTTTILTTDDQIIDILSDTFGVRLVELKDAQFYLNGESMRLVGLTRHADSPNEGLAETITMMTTDYDSLKELNMIFSRPVHYPQAEFIMDYCDRNGILLIPEVPAWQLSAIQMSRPQIRELEKEQLREMIAANYNHPSVWAWSIGNEFDSNSPSGHKFVEEMISYVKSLDATRPVSFASNHLNESPLQDGTQYADFVMMNQYFGTWAGQKAGLGPALDEIHRIWPEKPIIISEFGFEPHWNTFWGPPSSSLDSHQYYFIHENVASSSEEADEQRRMVAAEQMELFRSRPYVIGAVFWTYQDYRTPSGFMMGVVDADRNKRGSWSLLRDEFSPVALDSVTFPNPVAGTWKVSIVLQTRGPLGEDMPVYTLRDYQLSWQLLATDSGEVFVEDVIQLPILVPGETWTGEINWADTGEENDLLVRVTRPTGFNVLERLFNVP